ncbi:MAG: NADH-quinone oxidoreductase subunit L [Gemmataceae bacterium]
MFDDVANYLWLIPVLPLIASALTTLLGPTLLRGQSHILCILAAISSCVLSFMVLFSIQGAEAPETASYYTWYAPKVVNYYTWFAAGDVQIDFSLRADFLTAIMLVTVTFVGSLIAIYSIGYMHGDPGYPRYFAEISLFLFAMTGLVLANNYILLYAFWEGVGLCSYLLIGFWFQRPAAAMAARKAFLVTRIGDVGLFIGIILLWVTLGPNISALNYDSVADAIQAGKFAESPGLATLICLLLFCGAVGKSAQFPLHVWLPDAMEGPSSVSALIHAATMVTAGVYLVARSIELFVLSPGAQLVVACIGGLTALMAALMAVTQTDLKRVLAYSTISQLGYMFMALGAAVGHFEDGQVTFHEDGRLDFLEIGVVAAIFHLFTHAFFKALLFLGAGSVMHAMGDVIDMRKFGGLRKLLPYTHITFAIGAAALAGIPLLSGFWSKDEILAATYDAGKYVDGLGWVYMVLLVVGLITAALTAFYTARAYFMTFWGEEKIPPEAGDHAHESPMVMVVPLIILAVGAGVLGLILGPITGIFAHTLIPKAHHHEVNLVLMAISGLLALGGVGVAWWMYTKQPSLGDSLEGSTSTVAILSRNRFFFDEIYDIMIVKPASIFGKICSAIDVGIVDKLVDLVGHIPMFVGRLFSPLQNGLVQFYALIMMLGVVGFLLATLLR